MKFGDILTTGDKLDVVVLLMYLCVETEDQWFGQVIHDPSPLKPAMWPTGHIVTAPPLDMEDELDPS